MKTQRVADIVSGVFVALIGLILCIEASSIPNPLDEPLHPNTLPMSMAIFTVATGLLLAFRSYRIKDSTLTVEWPERDGWIRNGVFGTTLVVYLVLIPIIGMPISSALFTTSMIWYLERTIVRSVVSGVSVALILYYVFIKFLELPYPLGIFERI